MIPLYIYFGEVFSLILSHFLEKVHACMAYRLSHFGDVFFCVAIYIYRMSQTVVFWMVLVQLEHDMFFEQLPTSKGPPKEIGVLSHFLR